MHQKILSITKNLPKQIDGLFVTCALIALKVLFAVD